MTMEKKTIKILGQEVKICFNMATQLCFEEITGTAFSTASLDKTSNTLALYYSCILANNQETTISFDDLLEKATAKDIKILREAVLESFTDWCKSVVDDEPAPADKADAEKNA